MIHLFLLLQYEVYLKSSWASHGVLMLIWNIKKYFFQIFYFLWFLFLWKRQIYLLTIFSFFPDLCLLTLWHIIPRLCCSDLPQKDYQYIINKTWLTQNVLQKKLGGRFINIFTLNCNKLFVIDILKLPLLKNHQFAKPLLYIIYIILSKNA